MAAELRWILLGLSLLLLGGIWWWGVRRSAQSPGNAVLREPTIGKAAESAAVPGPQRGAAYGDPYGEPYGEPYGDSRGDPLSASGSADGASESGSESELVEREPEFEPEFEPEPEPELVERGPKLGPKRESARKAESRDWGVPPFEPLSIRTADFDKVPILDGPMMVHADPVEPQALSMPPVSPVPPVRPAPAGVSAGDSDRLAAVAPQAPKLSELQRIVTIRVCAPGETRWSGADLMAALESHGLAYGRYQVFHRRHADGRSLFCAASLVEPGTFDVARMPEEEFRGVTLFAVLPGPLEPVQTVDALFAAARGMAEELTGLVQDAKGMPMSPQRAAELREDIAQFQAMLPGA